jgi:hypothetical protein
MELVGPPVVHRGVGRNKGELMHISIGHLAPIVAIVAGVLILVVPRLLNYIVAIYLILVGLLGLGIIH